MVYTKEVFQEIYARYKESKLTIKAFCSNEGISRTKFYYWLRSMRKELESSQSTNAGFLPVNLRAISQGLAISGKKSSGKLEPFCQEERQYEIIYPNGVTVRINGPMTLEEYKALISLA